MPRSVLIVDDHPRFRATARRALECDGWTVVGEAQDGVAGLAEAERLTPDLVLLDIGLPDINGYEVARRIRGLEGLPQPRLIALTGWGQEQDKKLAAQAGFDDHWTKPVDSDRLQQLAA
jgi:CheY-like chemotaxis protein